MDWKDLALKASEQINEENWTQGYWWKGDPWKRDQCWNGPTRLAYDHMQPTEACVTGHLYWAAQEQGLTYDEARWLATQVEYEFATSHDAYPFSNIMAFNDADGRGAIEVAERLRLMATT